MNQLPLEDVLVAAQMSSPHSSGIVTMREAPLDQLASLAQQALAIVPRYLDGGISALAKDASRPGRPRTVSDDRTAEVIRKTTQEKPFNATHWSTRTMAAATGLSETTVRRIWHANGLKPHLVKTFKVSNDAQFAEKL